jgi:hypothetical protein
MRERNTSQPRGLSLSLVLLLCGVVLLASPATAKYIFTEEPLARFSPATGDQDLFGYAAALHLVDATGASSDFQHAIQNTKIIVGAPNGSFPGGLEFNITDDDALNNTGLVYVCNISCTSSDCCEALTGNGTGNDIRLFDYQGNSNGRDPFELVVELIVQDEQKSGQFMGATIVSTGEHIMACAPRWISLNTEDYFNGPFDKTRAHGRCFIADRNMENFKLLRPCDMDNSQTLVGQSYCMAGTAASLQEKQEGTDVQVFLGGPPFGESSGAVFSVNLTEAEIAGNSPLNLGSPDFNLIPKANTMQQLWYTGTALTLGRIFGSVEEDLIYSLPKKNVYKGSVEVFSIETGMIEATVLGEQMGEYFGWSVATADLNGDGFDEIIVGAPLFSTPDKIEKGRIFIYKNNGTLDTANPIVIPGTWSRGRYGSAIVNLGDINSDGFEDIAVSAPFESRGGGKGGAEGTVYIYLGSGESVIVTTPEDEITAADISSRLGFDESRVLKSFGYSLSSGVDVDANANNDLVIGDYIQQTVIVLRTHSIANVSLSLSTIPNELFEYRNTNTCVTDFGSFACFTLEITASYSGRGLDGPRPLDTKVAVRENAVSAGSRLFFLDSDKNRTDVFEGFLNFSATDTPITKPITVYVEGVEEKDRRRPLAVEVSVSRVERVTPINHTVDGFQDVFDLRDYPLLEVLPQNNKEQTLSLTGCENPDMCTPQLELSINRVRYLDSKKMPTEFEEIIAGRVSFIEVLLDYQTLTEDAVNSRLLLSLPPRLLGAPQSIRDTTGNALATSQCQLNREDDTYICAVHPIFSNYDGKFNVEIIIAVSDEVTGMDCVENCSAIFTIVNEDNNVADDSNNIARLNLSVSAIANVRISELSVNPNSTQYEDTNELKPAITTKVTLSNSGPSTIPESQVVILIPGKTDHTRYFYYLYPDTTRVPSSVVCSALDPDGLNLNRQNQQRRRKRSMVERVWRSVVGSEEEEEEEGGLQKRQEITRMVNCSRDPELCTAVVCNISDFSSTPISILVLSYVDNRFFRTQTGNFEFYMHANFNITSSFVDGPPSSRTSNRLVVLEPQKGSSEEVPAWVIAVTVISAIITVFILVGVIILLYALGFFKRRDKEEFAKKQELQRSQSTRVGSSSGPAAAAKTTAEPASLDSKPDEPLTDEATELNEKPPQPPTEEVAPEKTEALEKASSETEL